MDHWWPACTVKQPMLIESCRQTTHWSTASLSIQIRSKPISKAICRTIPTPQWMNQRKPQSQAQRQCTYSMKNAQACLHADPAATKNEWVTPSRECWQTNYTFDDSPQPARREWTHNLSTNNKEMSTTNANTPRIIWRPNAESLTLNAVAVSCRK